MYEGAGGWGWMFSDSILNYYSCYPKDDIKFSQEKY